LLRGRDPSSDRLWRSNAVVRATLAAVRFVLTAPAVPSLKSKTATAVVTNNDDDDDDPDNDVEHSIDGANDDAFHSITSEDDEDDEDDDDNKSNKNDEEEHIQVYQMFDSHAALLESGIVAALGYVALEAAHQDEVLQVCKS
jgi:hypothetical protein